jgi:hypothetical protein
VSDGLDRSVLEAKAVAELKEIAKSLDLKVSGLKKAEIIDAIAGNGGGRTRSIAQSGTGPGETPKTEREAAPPMEEQRSTNGSTSEQPQASDRKEAVRDEGAADDRRHDDQQRHRRPQNRSRVREKADAAAAAVVTSPARSGGMRSRSRTIPTRRSAQASSTYFPRDTASSARPVTCRATRTCTCPFLR